MMPRLRTSAVTLVALLVFSACAAAPESPENKLRDFARCLSDKGAVFYGAFWCDHCREQKEMFGAAFEHVRYVECGVIGNPRAQTQVCSTKEIKSYPTWEFADGERRKGIQPFAALAEKTGCKLP
jgi:hypothetical protein